MHRWTAIITMAGEGSRFRAEGYDCPKYEILARGKTLFEWSMRSLEPFFPHIAQWVFVTRDASARAFVEAQSAALGLESVTIVSLPALTDGQATTVLEALSSVRDPEARLLVYNIDTHLQPGAVSPEQVRGEGWIPCFQAPGDHWSFVRMGEDRRALEVTEKVRISPNCSVGLYDFGSVAVFQDAYRRLYEEGRGSYKERYVAPLYQQMLDDGQAVFGSVMPFEAVVPLGTPAELRAFDPHA